MASMKTYRELKAWQKAMDLIPPVYQLVKQLPPEEKYELGSQLRRAVVSVVANIAEGYGRRHRKEYLQHLGIAQGSLAEVETVAQKLNYIERDTLLTTWKQADETGKVLHGLIQSLEP